MWTKEECLHILKERFSDLEEKFNQYCDDGMDPYDALTKAWDDYKFGII